MEVIWKVENGPALISPKMFLDERGYFYESFNEKEFKEKVADVTFVQDNQSFSSYGVLRGMHSQEGEYAQAKLVRVIKGAVIDVIVDIRKDSPNYGRIYSAYLSEENHRQFFVPRGFLHGFLTLRNGTIFQYKCDNYYNKASERGYNYQSIPFNWENYIDKSDIRVSEKDLESPNYVFDFDF
jgi:dTDP-4-dehydrorhamnose 3,5-epimerase